jgi:hypothetical protein
MATFATRSLKCYVCCHVFQDTRPILLVAREQGDWMFLCGRADHASGGYRVVGVGHLTDRDSTLHQCADLPDDHEAERSAVGASWIRTPIDPSVD